MYPDHLDSNFQGGHDSAAQDASSDLAADSIFLCVNDVPPIPGGDGNDADLANSAVAETRGDPGVAIAQEDAMLTPVVPPVPIDCAGDSVIQDCAPNPPELVTVPGAIPRRTSSPKSSITS